MSGLGIVRLSRHSKKADDPSTSPERQKGHVLTAAERRGDTVSNWAVDLNVSARKVAPWHRPELGLWLPDLTDENNPRGGNPSSFDTIYFWKLDRLVRSVGDFAKIITWATANKKNLVSADGAIDLSTPMGRAMAQIVAVFAELEAAIIKERVNDARREVLSVGRWHGGRCPYGYVPVKDPEGGWRLVKDPEVLPVLEELIDRALKGEPLNSVALDFDARGIPTPKGGEQWVKVRMGYILRSRNLLGEFQMKEEIDGVVVPKTVKRAEPLIDLDTYSSLQKVLGPAYGDTPVRRRTGAAPLLGVAYCAHCGYRMYVRNINKSGNTYRYYGCSGIWGQKKNGCTAKTVRADSAEAGIEKILLDNIGDLEVFEERNDGGVDHSAELDEMSKKLAELHVVSAGAPDSVKKHLAPEIESLTELVNDLAAMPVVKGETTVVGTGSLYRETWETADAAGRRELLLKSGIKVWVSKRLSTEDTFLQPSELGDINEGVVIGEIYDDVRLMMYLPEDITSRTLGTNLDLRYRDQTIWTAHRL